MGYKAWMGREHLCCRACAPGKPDKGWEKNTLSFVQHKENYWLTFLSMSACTTKPSQPKPFKKPLSMQGFLLEVFVCLSHYKSARSQLSYHSQTTQITAQPLTGTSKQEIKMIFKESSSKLIQGCYIM